MTALLTVPPAPMHRRVGRQLPHWSLAAVGLMVAFGGCATWTSRDTVPTELVDTQSNNNARHNPGSIVVQTEFVTVSRPGSRDQWESIWQWADEAPSDPSIRQRWTVNGLRVGWVKDRERLDGKLASMSPGKDVIDKFMQQVELAGDASGMNTTVPMRMATRYEVPVRPPIAGQPTILTRLDRGIVARTLDSPQPLFAMTLSPGELDQTVRVTLRPEIQHGTMRQAFTQGRSGVRLDHRRASWTLDELELTSRLGEGDTLLISPTFDPVGLGETMFTQQNTEHQTTFTVMKLTIKRIPRASETM